MVHMGASLEQILPRVEERKNLLKELDGYVRNMVNHMLDFTTISWDA